MSFYLLETVFFYSEFFLLVETIIETWEIPILNAKYIPASEHQFFSRDFKILKWKQLFGRVQMHFSTNPSSG